MKKFFYALIPLSILLIMLIVTLFNHDKDEFSLESIEGEVIAVNGNEMIFQDINNVIYSIGNTLNLTIGDKVILEYTGVLNSLKENQTIEVISYQRVNASNELPLSWQDNGIFSLFYKQAYNKLKQMSMEEKIGQLLLVRYPGDVSIKNASGFIFYEKDFKDKTKEEVKKMITSLEDNYSIPYLMAVDEEGGKIVRISSNPNLRKEKFKSSKELYDLGGFKLIKEDTKEKSALLSFLGLNLNLAPVVDIATDSNAYIYPRTIGYNRDITASYASSVIEASKGTGVSYTLKHFPGYGNNDDTHITSSEDVRSYEEILNNDLVPFKSGIQSGAEAVLISHNVVTAVDPDNPASISSSVHNLLVSNLNFTGVSITDDLDMGATSKLNDRYVKSLLAGNNLLIVTDYQVAFNEIKEAVNNDSISEDYIDKLVFRVLAWKYYKGLLMENNK